MEKELIDERIEHLVISARDAPYSKFMNMHEALEKSMIIVSHRDQIIRNALAKFGSGLFENVVIIKAFS